MKVLVCAASKDGATSEIAQAAADVLAERGCTVTVLPPGKVSAVEEFDAAAPGSAVYLGQWMKPARELAERSASALAARAGLAVLQRPGRRTGRARRQPRRRHQSPPGQQGPATTRSSPASWSKSTSASPTGPWPQPSAPKKATSATGPRSETAQPASPAPCLLDFGPGSWWHQSAAARYQARPARAASHLHPQLQKARTGNSVRLAAAILPSLKRAPIRRSGAGGHGTFSSRTVIGAPASA
jgi:hypothetical protein